MGVVPKSRASSCVDAVGVAGQAWEAEIDERVARLYGL
jgi:hypothetical protein